MALKLKTRLNVSPAGRGRILLYFHKSQLDFVENELNNALLQMKDCAIYYYDADDADSCPDRPDSIQLIVVLISGGLLASSSEKVGALLRRAQAEKIPVLPIWLENVPIGRFEAIFGRVQYLTWFQGSSTEIPYQEKIRTMLDMYLVTDEMRGRVICAFRRKIFLSYRKADRALAQALMKMIHRDEENYDIAIWYDEHLVGGITYDQSILEALRSSDLFLLAMTPNVLKAAADGEANYVRRIELPEATRLGKAIVAVRMLPTEEGWQEALGLPDYCCISPEDAGRLCTAILGGRRVKDMSAEEKYLMGLAYLGGILVEKDNDRGIGLVTASAQEGYRPAMRELKDRYFIGNGVDRNYEWSFYWLNRLIETCDAGEAYKELEVSLQKYLEAGETDMVIKHAEKMFEYIGQMPQETMADAAFLVINESKVRSYMSDACMRDGQVEAGLYYARESCRQAEQLAAYMETKAGPVEQLQFLPVRKLFLDTLAVNYDHLADYLIRAGKTDEAGEIIARRRALSGSGDPKKAFYECIRESETAQNGGDTALAARWLEKALTLFDEGWGRSGDWKIMLEKAIATDRLAGLYVNDPSAEKTLFNRVPGLLEEAFRICSEILRYDPNNVPAMREQSIGLEIAGVYQLRTDALDAMMKSWLSCERLRADICQRFPSQMARDDLEKIRRMKQRFVQGTFLLTEARQVDEFGNRYGVLKADASTQLILEDMRLGSVSILAPINSVLRLLRTKLIGEEYNVGLSNIAAEILLTGDSVKQDHSLFLYEIEDNAGRYHYALFFSLAALELKIAELCEAGALNPSYLADRDGHFRIQYTQMKDLVLNLIRLYFPTIVCPEDFSGSTGFIPTDPETMYFDGNSMYGEVNDGNSKAYYCYCMQVKAGRYKWM